MCYFCMYLQPSGVYIIYLMRLTSAVKVCCDMITDEGKWTVFLRRMNFYRPLSHYKRGFGNAEGEHWLGLDNSFHISLRKRYELREDMDDFAFSQVNSSTHISPLAQSPLGTHQRFHQWRRGDLLMAHQNGHKFSTFDKENI